MPDYSALTPSLAARARTVRLPNGVDVYYKEAGESSRPTILLLHGFPASSNYFRAVVPLLAARRFHVIAPDLPGFGATECPPTFAYTFQKLAETVVLLLEAIDVSEFVVYCMGEYGTLVALKVVQYKQETVLGLVIQNGTAYNESRLDTSLLDVYHTGTESNVSSRRASIDSDTTSTSVSLSKDKAAPLDVSVDDIKSLYTPLQQPKSADAVHAFNRSKPCTIDPHAYLLDYYMLCRPGQPRIQRQLYQDLLAHHLAPQALSSPVNTWLRTTTTPVLVLWGTNDPLLDEQTTLESFKRDCRHCEVRLLENGGHYALEHYPEEVAQAVADFVHASHSSSYISAY